MSKLVCAVAALSLAACQAIQGDQAAVDAILSTVPERLEATGTDGMNLVVVRDQQVLTQSAYGQDGDGVPLGPTTSCGLFSATKVLASLTYASLAEDGVVAMSDTVGSVLPDAPEAWQPITLAQLLNHSHGIPMVVRKEAFGPLAEDPERGNAAALQLVRDDPLEWTPGEQGRYRQVGYAVAEEMLRIKTGKSFAELLEEHVLEPAGATATRHPSLTTLEKPLLQSAGNYETTPGDMLRVFQALHRGDIVDLGFLESFLSDERHVIDGYSIGSIIEDVNGTLTFGHRGGGARAQIRFAPSEKIAAMACTADTTNDEMIVTLVDDLMAALIESPPAN